ncbi:aldehyde dehydrogenase family protein [Nodularia spumigena CS-584]|jgi:succinate-semialdehyde dehydrogenase / glutarate-semialdehyde dehydrogenase|uniref:Aldehyde dehydrogenase family protein n=1 Tax=Nodularia spumigena UHCC 0060 TaxID=3110300 RepID=A0ABU5USN7_NODSP|nr:aldehyde dehydrogenase family protein [Nodularia spumigena]AHJ27988.1 aldehyde dehydrogenase [Nodularia spumigena CCY9414]EAW43428.1 aldehyde dehydrogenase [Nodularia spumigena CCY9414]MDB9385003.1 aldehyde dehydrogenase family protein [Nodularia spumigena CS-584]MEA5524033.1 aldehyde dehydrogenase family protein [Nodularia spumigena UHCC 0143]MEA5555281.1 aldehyde dehydrogenase family protein [Nodularia spumigena CH309]
MTKPIEVRNPRTGEFDYIILPPPPRLLVHKCNRARRAQIHWKNIGLEARIDALQQWKQAIIYGREQLTEALVSDTGRLSTSVLEIDSFLSSINRWCRLAPELLQISAKNTAIPFITLQQASVPYPLVGVISPWNFPLLLSTIDTIPALLAGCAVIVKPSEIAPRFVAPLITALNNVPDLRDVLSFAEGAGETGATLVENVDLICFTGSVATGQKVAEAAARRFIPAFLELGGKDPAIVLESADLELATSAILWGSVVNSGQSCLSIERIYVAESIFEEFYHQLVVKAHRLQLAHPRVDSGEIGPIIAEKQAAIINDHLLDAVSKGALIHCGGQVEELGGGWWCRPTVITQVNHSMKVMTEETFGPIMPVMPFPTVEEAVYLANDSIYGLSAAVFAETEAEALAVADQIDAGAISINDAALTAIMHEGEKNSFKFSGLGGSRMGPASIKRFLRKKAFLIKTNSSNDPWWFNDQ